MMHIEAKKLIEQEICCITTQLSQSADITALVKRKRSLMDSLRLLDKMSDYRVEPKAVIYELPFPASSGAFSEFRLMDDMETEDRSVWSEVDIAGANIRAIAGDIVILNSEKLS